MKNLEIKNLYVSIKKKEILKGVNLVINPGEIHAIMGPNGTGKSTLSSVIMGDPRFTVNSGEIIYNGEDVLEMEVDERAKAGLFLAMQYPSEISGITNSDFIRSAMQSIGKNDLNLYKYINKLESNIELLKMDKEMAHRYLNEGFSGGEKKRNEILQMMMLEPSLAILDEIDSGLDIDALTIVGETLTSIIKERQELSYLIITHYERLLEYIKPTHVHVMLNGKLVESGGYELVKFLETTGYESFKEKYNIIDEVEEKKVIKAICRAGK